MINRESLTDAQYCTLALSPLVKLKDTFAKQTVELTSHRSRLQKAVEELIQENRALPTHLRHMHQFRIEEQVQTVLDSAGRTLAELDKMIRHVPVMTAETMQADPLLRDKALHVIYEIEQACRASYRIATEMVEEADLKISSLLTTP